MVMLSVCSVEDWKKKEVSVWKIIIYGTLVFGYGVWELFANHESAGRWMLQAVAGGMPGIVLLILAKATREAVGYGDGILSVIIGMSMGFWQNIGILSTALLAIFCTAVYYSVSRRKAEKKRIAFVPFLLFGMAGAGLWMDF